MQIRIISGRLEKGTIYEGGEGQRGTTCGSVLMVWLLPVLGPNEKGKEVVMVTQRGASDGKRDLQWRAAASLK